MSKVTVVGGGLAGLVAAVESAERGRRVHLLEAKSRLGGRASTTEGVWKANYGAHAIYTGGALWDWLSVRRLNQGYGRGRSTGLRFRWRGRRRRTPPTTLLRGIAALRREAPVDEDFRSWMTRHAGPEAAAAVVSLAGVLTFDQDSGRCSAAFVAHRIRRILLHPRPITRYPPGGWATMIDSITALARELGVRIETSAPVDSLPSGPCIVAVEPKAARKLLGADFPRSGTHAAFLDVGLEGASRSDAFIGSDLDDCAFAERFSDSDPTVAPRHHSLIQAFVGLRPEETMEAGVTRIESLLDVVWTDWRKRETWRRRAVVNESTGALDLPGTTWRDRPAVAHAPGVWLCGDWVAAPGHLSEVSVSSAVEAASRAVASSASAIPSPIAHRAQR
jgi:phytoene dehydrogenase-like protein